MNVDTEKNIYINKKIIYSKKKKAEVILNSKHANRGKINKVWRWLKSDGIISVSFENFLEFVIDKRKSHERIQL